MTDTDTIAIAAYDVARKLDRALVADPLLGDRIPSHVLDAVRGYRETIEDERAS